MPQRTKAQEKEAGKLMRDMADEFIPKGLFEKAVLRAGSPHHEIATAARVLDAGLIKITTHEPHRAGPGFDGEHHRDAWCGTRPVQS